MIRVVVTDTAFSPALETAEFAASRDDDCGALASFVGYCRGRNGGEPVSQLELQHYPGFTEAEIQRIARDVTRRNSVAKLLAIHRVGTINPGEAIVLVAALSAHRAAAFAAVEEMMDYLKTDAPLWKRETGADGARWIDPTADDYARRAERGS